MTRRLIVTCLRGCTSAISGSTLIILSGVGHFASLQGSSQFVEAVVSFFGG